MKQRHRRLKVLEERRLPVDAPRGCVVFIDPATGRPVPGAEPDPNARVIFVLPLKDPRPDPGPPPKKGTTSD